MTAFGHLPLQKAIYQALTANAPLMALLSGVYDRTPQNSDFPYITIGESTSEDWSTKTTSGTQQIATLHVWSREGGRKQAATIMDHIYGLLHDASLSVEEHTLVLIRFSSSSILLENDGWTYQGIMRFRTLMEAD